MTGSAKLVKHYPMRKMLLEICDKCDIKQHQTITIIPICKHPYFDDLVHMPPLNFTNKEKLREFAESLHENDSDITFNHWAYKGQFTLVKWEIHRS